MTSKYDNLQGKAHCLISLHSLLKACRKKCGAYESEQNVRHPKKK